MNEKIRSTTTMTKRENKTRKLTLKECLPCTLLK